MSAQGAPGLLWTKIPIWELVWFLLELDWECDKTWSSFRLRFNILAQCWALRGVDSSGLLLYP